MHTWVSDKPFLQLGNGKLANENGQQFEQISY